MLLVETKAQRGGACGDGRLREERGRPAPWSGRELRPGELPRRTGADGGRLLRPHAGEGERVELLYVFTINTSDGRYLDSTESTADQTLACNTIGAEIRRRLAPGTYGVALSIFNQTNAASGAGVSRSLTIP